MNTSAQSVDFPTPYDYRRALAKGSKGRGIAPQLKFRAGPMGLIMMAGANAAVLPAILGERSVALRLFTNRSAASRHRYAELTTQLVGKSVRSLAWVEWTDDGIDVDGDLYPALLMEWIEGVQLDQYVRQLVDTGQTQSLRQLADDFIDVTDDLIDAEVAHGDLQHGNILIETGGGGIRLVDFDGIWVPALDGDLPDEAGHDSYQHPARRSGQLWNRYADTFPALVIYTSLSAIGTDPSLWSTFGEVGSHLILRDEDLIHPDRNGDRWNALFSSGDKAAVELLFDLCVQDQPHLDQPVSALIEGASSGPSAWWPEAPNPPSTDASRVQPSGPFSIAPDSPHGGLAAAEPVPEPTTTEARPDPVMTTRPDPEFTPPKVGGGESGSWWGPKVDTSGNENSVPESSAPMSAAFSAHSRPPVSSGSEKRQWWLRPGYVILLLLAVLAAVIIIGELTGA